MKSTAALFKLPLGCILFGLLCWSPLPLFAGGGGHAAAGGERAFPIPESSYAELEAQQLTRQGQAPGLIEQLKIRAAADPFNLVATTIFFLAVVHTFLAAKFNRLAHRYEQLHRSNMRAQQKRFVDGRDPVSFRATLFHFLGRSRRSSAFGWFQLVVEHTTQLTGHSPEAYLFQNVSFDLPPLDRGEADGIRLVFSIFEISKRLIQTPTAGVGVFYLKSP